MAKKSYQFTCLKEILMKMVEKKFYSAIKKDLFLDGHIFRLSFFLSQGMFIVTFPYCVLEGGYWAILAMIGVAWICYYTGNILVECLYETDDMGMRVRVRDSYVRIAEDVWGRSIGGRIVHTALLIELLMTCILYVLLCGDLMVGLMPNSDMNLASWIMLSTFLLVPCAFLRSLRAVSWFSFWCTVAHMFINAIIIIYCLTKASDWKFADVQIRIDISTLPISVGIVVFSYTSQIFLPSLEGSLHDRRLFSPMLKWTHIAAAVFKALFSYIGFVTWGFSTKEVITNNLSNDALKSVVNLFLVAKALLSYPLPYFAAVQLLETALFKGRPLTVFPPCYDSNANMTVWALTLRIGLVVLTMLFAIYIPHFNVLMGLIGAFTGNMLSLVWPCWFHLKLRKGTLGLWQKTRNYGIIIFGLVCSVLGIYDSAHGLVRAFQGHEPRPFQGG